MPIKALKTHISESQRTAILAAMNAEKISMNAWCERAGINEATLRSFLAGRNNSLGSDNLKLLANSIGKTVGQLLGEDTSPVLIQILGYVGAGEMIYPLDDHAICAGLEEIECPPGMPTDVAAVIVRGDSMEPAFEDGWIIFYQKHSDGVPPDCIGETCVVKLMDDAMLVKKVRQGSKPNLFHLISKNPSNQPMVDKKLRWAAKVLFIKTT